MGLNSDQIDRVKEMAGVYHDKKLIFDQLGLRPTLYDLEERRKQTIEYEVARAEMLEAKRDLEIAQGL